MDAHTDQPSDRPLRVLLIEDSESDAELAMWRLKEAGYVCTFRCAVNEIEMRAALRAELPDLILSDFSLPGFSGMTALAIARVEAAGVPFIFLSGTIGEERAIEALKCGAIDYVLKSNPKRLVPAVERALQEAELRRTSQLAEQQVARLTGVLQMLSGINSALVRIQNRDEVMAETCRLAHRVGGYKLAMLALINPTTRMARLRISCSAGAGVSGLGSRSRRYESHGAGHSHRRSDTLPKHRALPSCHTPAGRARRRRRSFAGGSAAASRQHPGRGLPLRHRGQRRYWSG